MLRWLIAALLIAVPAQAVEVTWPLRDPIAYDGDTLYVEIPGIPSEIRRVSIRVLGVDTPEIRGKCEAEKALARQARDLVRSIFAGARSVRIDLQGWGKYGGRVLAIAYTPDGRDLADVLIEARLGRAYDGGKRQGWC